MAYSIGIRSKLREKMEAKCRFRSQQVTPILKNSQQWQCMLWADFFQLPAGHSIGIVSWSIGYLQVRTFSVTSYDILIDMIPQKQ
jgi:hypothetical protein